MATIKEMENRLLEAKSRIPSEMELIITRLSDKIVELNKEGQLFKGENTKGRIVGRYSRTTQEITEGMTGKGYPKTAGDPFNFYDTGDLFKAFTIDFQDGKLEIFSTDSKATDLEARYGKSGSLFGLNIEHQHVLNYDLIKPELLKSLKKIIYG